MATSLPLPGPTRLRLKRGREQCDSGRHRMARMARHDARPRDGPGHARPSPLSPLLFVCMCVLVCVFPRQQRRELSTRATRAEEATAARGRHGIPASRALPASTLPRDRACRLRGTRRCGSCLRGARRCGSCLRGARRCGSLKRVRHRRGPRGPRRSSARAWRSLAGCLLARAARSGRPSRGAGTGLGRDGSRGGRRSRHVINSCRTMRRRRGTSPLCARAD